MADSNIISPCKKCTEGCIGCYTTCDEYAIYRQAVEASLTQYIVRLHSYNGAIIHGAILAAENKDIALLRYKAQCKRIGIAIAHGDYFSTEEYND